MSTPADVVLGPAGGAAVELRVLSRAHPGGLGTLRGWLLVDVTARDGRGTWNDHVFLRDVELGRFESELAGLRAGRRDRARLAPRDPWVAGEIARVGDGWAAVFRARTRRSERVSEVRWRCGEAEIAALARSMRRVVARFPPGA